MKYTYEKNNHLAAGQRGKTAMLQQDITEKFTQKWRAVIGSLECSHFTTATTIIKYRNKRSKVKYYLTSLQLHV